MSLRYDVTHDLSIAVAAALDDWHRHSKVARLWEGDSSLWTDDGERDWLGWLRVVDDQLAGDLGDLERAATLIGTGGYSHVLLLGMGGSSLGPEMLASSFGQMNGSPELVVLDSTDPAQVRSMEGRLDLARTFCIVSSKSGTTLETSVLRNRFYDSIVATVGEHRAASRFAAITDEGSELEDLAKQYGFEQVFLGRRDVGGRFSTLSNFGLVPAAAVGIDAMEILQRAAVMSEACKPDVPADDNPGLVLGCVLGVAAGLGRDKLTLVTSPGIWDFGAWLEQLVAESTGKNGKAIIPVDGERLAEPGVYGSDRIFVAVELASEQDEERDAALDRLIAAGHPVVRIRMGDEYDLGQEMFRWEFATAVVGSIMGVNPFSQPDVEASKATTRNLMEEYETTGVLPTETPFVSDDSIALYAHERDERALRELAGDDAAVDDIIATHMKRLGAGDYFAILAYLEMNDVHQEAIQAMRHAVRDSAHVATTGAFGPRYLHSTGQAHKGGPSTGVFLQITAHTGDDLDIPTRPYTFGVVEAAQARGDCRVLADRGRRLLRVHIRDDLERGLTRLGDIVAAAMDRRT